MARESVPTAQERGTRVARRLRWLAISATIVFAMAGFPANASDVSVAIGDLPEGKKVRVHFDVTVNTGLDPLVMEIENQGTVGSSSMAFGDLLTDDPDDATGDADPTVTPLDGLTLGNLVWLEKTGNSVFDPVTADAGIDGLLVNLYLDDGDGVLDAGDGPPIATDTTAGGGLYGFAGLQPGDYLVELPQCNFTGGAPCSGMPKMDIASLPGTTDPDDDVDNDDNGDPVAGFGVATAAVTLAFGTEPTDDGDSDADTNLSVDFGFINVADLGIDKSDSGADAVAGAPYTYTLEVTNNGPAASTGSTVTDTLPAGWTYVSSTGACAGDGMSPVETVTCTVGPLMASGMSATTSFDITVMVPSSALAGTVTNTASVAGAELDPVAANNSDSEMTTVALETDLALDKSDSGVNVAAGETYVYTLEVTNNGPSDSSGGTVTDTLPAGWSYVSATGGTCAGTATGFTCTVDPLADGAMQTFMVTVLVPSSAAAGTVTNEATVDANEMDSTPGNDSDSEMTTVVLETDLEIDKSDSGLAVAGESYPYTLKITNNGPSDSTGGTASDTLPAGWTFVSATGGTCVMTAGGFDCTVDPLAAGAMQTFIATVLVPSSEAVGMVTNSASVTANETDLIAANDDDSEMTDVIREVDLVVTKTESADPIFPGVGTPGNLTYVVTVENQGPSDATAVSVSEDLTLPAPDVVVDSVTPSAGSFTPTTAPDGNWDGFDLAAGASETLTVVISAGPAAPLGMDIIGNTATVTSIDASETLIGTGDDEATETTSIAPLTPDFTKAFMPNSIGEQSETNLVFTIDNTASPMAASGLDFTDTLPGDLEVAAVPNLVDTCAGTTTANPGSGTISHTGGTVGANSDCTIEVAIFAPTPGSFLNTTGDLTSSAGNSGPAADTLTVAPCLAADGPNLTLGSDVVLTPETYEVCNTITVEQHYLVLGPGVLTLRAGFSVVFSNGVEIGTDGELVVEIDPSLMP